MVRSPLRHIVIIQLGSLAQTAVGIHSLRGLTRDFPELKITVLTQSVHRPLFAGVDGMDFIYADEEYYKGLGGRLRLWWKLQRVGADALADLTATPLARMLSFTPTPWRRKRVRISQRRPEGRELTRKYRKVLVQLTPTATRIRDLFATLGLPFNMPAPPRRNRTAPLPDAVKRVVGGRMEKSVGVALLSPNHGTCYPLPLACKLIEQLAELYPRVVVFGHGEYQRQFAEGMQTLHNNVVSVAGRLTLEEEMALIAHLGVVVTIDGDLLRLASLVGTPAVSLWGATHPFLESSGYGQDPKNAIQHDMPCRPCTSSGKGRCLVGRYACMHSITPEEVVKRVKTIVRPPRGADFTPNANVNS